MVSLPIDSPSNISIQESFPISRKKCFLGENISPHIVLPLNVLKVFFIVDVSPSMKRNPSHTHSSQKQKETTLIHNSFIPSTTIFVFHVVVCPWTMEYEIRTMRWSLLSILYMSNFEMVTILHSYDKSFSRKGLLTMMSSMMFSMMTMMAIETMIMVIMSNTTKMIINKH